MEELDLELANQICAGVEAAKPAFRRHKCGTFSGTIIDIEVKRNPKEQGQKIYEIFVETAQGVTSHNMWGISPSKIKDTSKRDEIIKDFQRHKRLMVDLGIWTQEESGPKKWSDVQMAYGQIKGKKCQIVIGWKLDDYQTDKYGNKKVHINTFLNRFVEGKEDVVDQSQPPEFGGNRKPGTFNSTPPSAGIQSAPNTMTPGIGSMSDDIPF